MTKASTSIFFFISEIIIFTKIIDS